MAKPPKPPELPPVLTRHRYKSALVKLQIELVKLQRHTIERGLRVLVILEGRDTAGKDGAIKRMIEHMSPRDTRVVALPPPSDRERHSWYFQRYVPHLPVSGEIVLLNRSWYNRAGVERVMGFCTEAETVAFLATVGAFEDMLIQSGIAIVKYYLDITKKEQRRRLAERRDDPLKQWKLSPVDDQAPKLWDRYSAARDRMLKATHTTASPWLIVRGDDKQHARLNIIRDLLWRLDYPDRDHKLDRPDPRVLFTFGPGALESGLIAP